MAELYPRNERTFNGMIAHMDGIQAALKAEANRIEGLANTRLEAARGSTQWTKIDDPAGQTKIGVDRPEGDYSSTTFEVWMEAYKQGAMALEFGHAPSGVFGPGGRLSHVKTKAPYGLYIMTGAYIQA
jgi:hypothetical protein